jgi:hypothetical protein
MKDHFIVRTKTLTDKSCVYDVYFFDGVTGNSETCVYNAVDEKDAGRCAQEMNNAIGNPAGFG